MLKSNELLCSAFVSHKAKDCNPKFQLEIYYKERLCPVTSVRHFFIKTQISLQIFELPEIYSQFWCCMLDVIKQIMITRSGLFVKQDKNNINLTLSR